MVRGLRREIKVVEQERWVPACRLLERKFDVKKGEFVEIE